MEEYKVWLIDNSICKSKKTLTDCISRTKYVEKAFGKLSNTNYDLDNEYQKDRLIFLRNCLSHFGDNQYMKAIAKNRRTIPFNIGNVSVGQYANAILQYQRFCDATISETIE